MDNSIFEEIYKLYQKEEVEINEVRVMHGRLEDYLHVCPKEEKWDCEKKIYEFKSFIEWSEIRTKFRHQKKVL